MLLLKVIEIFKYHITWYILYYIIIYIIYIYNTKKYKIYNMTISIKFYNILSFLSKFKFLISFIISKISLPITMNSKGRFPLLLIIYESLYMNHSFVEFF